MADECDRRAGIAAAVRRAYADEARITQDELAARIGGTVNQGMVSRWARGEVTPDLDTIAAIEAACGVPKGFILRLADYVDEEIDVARAIGFDRSLSKRQRREVLSYYEFVRSRSAESDR